MSASSLLGKSQMWQYVDPRIGSEGVGRTFPGPSMPFGMCKPGPDCTVLPNAGWAPMPEVVTGFSQTHVSGTGGGQKYGNILIQPFLGNGLTRINTGSGLTRIDTDLAQRRVSEEISLGYYATTFESGIRTEITTSERCAFYRIHYPSTGSLLIDASHFLGKDSVPDLRERQQFVGAEVEIVSDCEVRGFSRIRGGWNNGDAYTVYFCLMSDKKMYPTPNPSPERGGECLRVCSFPERGGECLRVCSFPERGGECLRMSDSIVNIKIGISYVSTQQARRNIPDCDFDTQLNKVRAKWDQILSRIQIKGSERDKRLFYTALYHTMLMPVDKSGENPKWTETPYYDDYYAIWDTYRTSTPLITLLDEERQVAIVNSLLNIYKREGYMPDARSGDCNGRTQGGSNAEVVIADAFVKGLGREGAGARGRGGSSIDYHLALEAMLKDADADPGADHEKHGRGGLLEYNRLGYIPYGIDRAGTRTIEYAYDDYCIAEVAKGLGREDLYERFMRQSRNWRNLWRSDYEWDDVRGYIMPRDAEGRWLDSVPWGRSKVFHPTIPYTPVTKVAPWYLPWWSTFFYEALSAEYSLSIPHDVPGLIEACGGEAAFRKRLDMFFERKRYNVGNEPSFLTPCLYHWIGRPDLTSDRVRQIVTDNYTDKPDGLPGNDDSGSMSSWLAFHQLGLYPNAGQDYYLLHAPLLPEWTMRLCNGRTLHAIVKGKGTHFERVAFNGRDLPDARIRHADLMTGGELVYYVSKNNSHAGTETFPNWDQTIPTLGINRPLPDSNTAATASVSRSISFTLNRQHRTWPLTFGWTGDTLMVTCKAATYKIAHSIVENATGFCWDIPADGAVRQPRGTFAFVSRQAVRDLREKGTFVYDGITWRVVDGSANHLRADIDQTEMWIEYCEPLDLWLVTGMSHNPLGIDWRLRQE